MSRYLGGLVVVALPACDRERGNAVDDELAELAEARKHTGARVQELQQELEQAKARVVQLEEQLALAKQGITEDVVEERREVQDALQENRREVEEEASEAQREAERLKQRVNAAEGALEQTKPPTVEGHVESGSQVTQPAQRDVQTETERREIEIQRVKGRESDTEQAPPQQPEPEHPRDDEQRPEQQRPVVPEMQEPNE